MKKNLFLLIGASGAGKTTEEDKLSNEKDFAKAVSFTTRKPRVGEVDGVDYDFITEKEYYQLLKTGGVIESVVFDGTIRGILEQSILKITERNILLVITPDGAQQVIEWVKSQKTSNIIPYIIYFDIPEKERVKNMQLRGDTPEMISKRLKNDNIIKEWKKSNLQADYIVKILNNNTHKNILNWIRCLN